MSMSKNYPIFWLANAFPSNVNSINLKNAPTMMENKALAGNSADILERDKA